uniref:Uncharacterized protein n=1 Tax=Aegilops tauschii subsp. strangulata TaxID=200361 RepID=A0A453LRG8_AEGTS
SAVRAFRDTAWFGWLRSAAQPTHASARCAWLRVSARPTHYSILRAIDQQTDQQRGVEVLSLPAPLLSRRCRFRETSAGVEGKPGTCGAGTGSRPSSRSSSKKRASSRRNLKS